MKKSSATPNATAKPPAAPRVPPAHGGIQYNACKNPKCRNFGVPAEEIPLRAPTGGPYAIVSGGRGYLSGQVSGIKQPLTITLSKDGSYAGTARVQVVAHRPTEHTLSLVPRDPIWNLDELSVLAAMVERHEWRFGFARAATKGRVENLLML